MTDIVWNNVTVTLGQLQPWERNPKSISKSHAKRLLASWDKFGQFQTVAIGPGFEVYDGHQRLSVLRAAFGDGYQVDARQSSRELTDSERRELVIAAHVGTTGQFNWDELANWDAAELQEWGLDGETLQDWRTGIGALTELIEAAKPEPEEDPGAQVDKADELREKWGVETGQMWRLGEHRIICGDCTDRAVVERVMGGEKADLLVTSPPYYNQREYSQWENYDKYLEFVRAMVDCANYSLSDNSVFVVNIGSDEQARRWMPSDWWCVIRDSGAEWLYRECIAWVKAAAVWSVPRSMHIEKGHYFPALRWEVILVISRGKHPSFDMSDRDKIRKFDENVWEIGVVTGGEQKAIGHNAPYPVEIPERFTMVYTLSGGIVYEPFSGSGTTIIACERLGRKCRAVEISPGYVAVAIQRWVDMTGGTPELITDEQ